MFSSKNKKGFHRSRQAAELMANLLVCTKCKERSEDLQYLGTACKHPFCWECVASFRTQVTAKSAPVTCPTCSNMLEPTKPSPSTLYNNLQASMDTFQRILGEYEEAVKREGGIECIATQQIFDACRTTLLQPAPLRSVDEFLSTQQMSFKNPDDVGDPLLETSRRCTPLDVEQDLFDDENLPPNSPFEKEFTLPPTIADVLPTRVKTPLKLQEISTNSPSKSTRTPSTSRRPDSRASTKSPHTKIKAKAKPKPQVDLFMTQMLFDDNLEKEDDEFQAPVQPPKPMKMSKSFEIPPSTSAMPKVQRRATTSLAEELWEQQQSKDSPGNSRITEELRSSSRAGSAVSEAQNPETSQATSMAREAYLTPPRKLDKVPNPRKSNSKKGELQLITAVLTGNVKALMKLINDGYNINEYDEIYGTPLYAAVEKKRLDMCQILIENGSIINAYCGPECNTALHVAVEKGYTDIAKYLLSKGACATLRNIRQVQPIEMAANQPPMKGLFASYRSYPRQPSIPPELPKKCYFHVEPNTWASFNCSERNFLMAEHQHPNMVITTPGSANTTHYVVGVDEDGVALFSHEILIAMIKGIQVVTKDWLVDCITKKICIMDTLRYEVQKLRFRDCPIAEGSVTKCRKSRERMEPGLFKGCKFYIISRVAFFGGKTMLADVIRWADGEVLVREPYVDEKDPKPFHAPYLNSPYFVLYDPFSSSKMSKKLLETDVYHKVTADWVYQCLLQYQFMNPY